MGKEKLNFWKLCEDALGGMCESVKNAARDVENAAKQTLKNDENIQKNKAILQKANEAIAIANKHLEHVPTVEIVVPESVEEKEEEYLTDTKRDLLKRTMDAALYAQSYVNKLMQSLGNPSLTERLVQEARVANDEFRRLILELKIALPLQAKSLEEALTAIDETLIDLHVITLFVNPLIQKN